MKLLKRVLLLIVVVIVIGVIYVAMQPSHYNIKRNHVIKAPITNVFNTVNNLKTWEKWGPWHDEDSTIVITYGEKTVGVGASDSWTSKDGPGSMKIIAVEQNKSIHQKMQFGDFEPTDIHWTFKEVDGGTEVSWRMEEKNAPFVFKIFAAMSGGWDAMFGPMEEQGLKNLEGVILDDIKNNPSYRLSEVKTVNTEAKTFIGFHHKMKINHDNMTKAFQQDMPKAGMFAVKSGLKYGDFTPGSVYTMYDEKTEETEFYVGLLLHKKLKPGKDMVAIKLKKGNGVMISKFGNYGVGDEKAHMAIEAYLKTNKLKQGRPFWELYVNDPTSVKPKDIQTDIYYPIK